MRSKTIARASLAAMLTCMLSCGCSSQAGPITAAPSKLNYPPTAAGLNDLLGSAGPDEKDQLRAFCDSSADSTLKQKSSYVLARLLQRSATSEDLKESLLRFAESSKLPSLWERSLWHSAEVAQSANDEASARSSLESIAKKSKTPETQAAAYYALGQSFMRTGERDKAKAMFEQVSVLAPASQYALGASYYLAQIETAQANSVASPDQSQTANTTQVSNNPLAPPHALAALRHYLDASPDGRFAVDVVSQLSHMDGFEPTAADHNRFARVYYVNGAYGDALSEWRKAGNTTEWFKQANCLMRSGHRTEGKAALQAGINAHPEDSAVEPAAVLLCRYLTKDGAIAVWKGVLQNSPRFADVAMYNLATRAASDAEGLTYFRKILSDFPNSTHAPDAGWWTAWSDIQAGRSPQAIAELQTVAARYPEAKATPRCMFWIGKVYERLGKKQEAKEAYAALKLHARSYYGHRARARLAALGGGKDPGWSIKSSRIVKWSHDSVDDWAFPEPPQTLAQQAGNTIAVLTELRQWDECLELLKEKTGLLRAFYLAKKGLPLNAINAAYSTLGTTPEKTEAWQLAYPLLYAKFIAAEAPTKKLDPFLVQALIREESRYNTQAVSGSNALGLMQLMPATAYGVAKRLGIRLSGHGDIHKPENNLRMGIDYLSYVLGRFNGSALHAVASYNGGPNAVARWATRWPGDPDVFVENIPFTETRDYVRKVFGSYWNYEAIYG